jgi:hypothetical protein
MISASDGPSPNTVWVAFFHKGHARQDVASRRKPPRLSVAAAVITFIFYRPLPELKSILLATKSAGAFVFHGDRNNFARGAFAGFSSADRKDTPMPEIRHSRILILATDGFEQLELTVPRDELRKAGAHVDVATPNGNRSEDGTRPIGAKPRRPICGSRAPIRTITTLSSYPAGS